MEIHLPLGQRFLPHEEEAWIEHVACSSQTFHALYPPEFGHALFDKRRARKFLQDRSESAPFLTEMWNEHVTHMLRIMMTNPNNCLRDPLVQYACNLSAGGFYARKQIPYLRNVFSDSLEKYLFESPFPGQSVFNVRFLSEQENSFFTSETRVHHLTHLAIAQDKFKSRIEDWDLIVEFGAGYGGMADLIRKFNKKCTYVIIDLPEMILLQEYMLKSVLGSSEVVTVNLESHPTEKGKINLVSISDIAVLSRQIPSPNLFIATWSLSESNRVTRKLVEEDLKFFNASRVLFGYRSFSESNSRQPESHELLITPPYKEIFHDKCFYSELGEQKYQLLKLPS